MATQPPSFCLYPPFFNYQNLVFRSLWYPNSNILKIDLSQGYLVFPIIHTIAILIITRQPIITGQTSRTQ